MSLRRDLSKSFMASRTVMRIGGSTSTIVGASDARWREEIDEAYEARNWSDVVTLIEELERTAPHAHSVDLSLKLVASFAHLRDFEAVDRVLEQSLSRYPRSVRLLETRASRAMMTREFSVALDFWQRAISSDAADSAHSGTFPTRGKLFDWYETAWTQCVDSWLALWEQVDARPSALMCQKVLRTLHAAGELKSAVEFSSLALKEHPNHYELAKQASETIARHSPDIGTERLVDLLVGTNNSVVATNIAAEVARSKALLDDIRALGPTPSEQLRVLTVYRFTGSDLAIRSSNFWDERRIHSEALNLAKRDRWPEQIASIDLVSEAAWSEAQRFARSRAKRVGVSAAALARAVFHYFKQEVTQKVPVDRIADEIAKTRTGDPIFLDLGSLKVPYLVSYPTSRMQTLYFYDALRKRGCNVVLVRFPRRATAELPQPPQKVFPPSITLVPQPAQLMPPGRILEAVAGTPKSMLVPAGIRSVRRVLNRVDDTIVVNSGSAVKGHAYDRASAQQYDYQVNMDLHPRQKDLLPTFRFTTEHLRTWQLHNDHLVESSDVPRSGHDLEAFLSIGTFEARDWHVWLERAILPYFTEFVKRTRSAVRERGISEVHVGDYLYAEPALIAAKVADQGGRVHVWPHSANPVHVGFQDHRVVTSVHAVTRSGAAAWRRALPAADIHHDASLMLDPPGVLVPHEPSEPLSVVVIGGRPIMRNLPILDIAAHEQLYKGFFAGLEPDASAGKLRVYFKPRGRTGEHEAWLEGVVGRAGAWERILDHPLRMTVPNPVFVSLSVGSSALLEGVTRGIPGLILRDGFARDYLATAPDLFDTLSLESGLNRIRTMTNPGVWKSVRDQQVERLTREMGRS